MFASFYVLLQLFPPESFAGKLRFAAEERSLFVVIGVFNSSTIAALGVMTFFVPAWPQLIADVAIVVGGVTGVETSAFVWFENPSACVRVHSGRIDTSLCGGRKVPKRLVKNQRDQHQTVVTSGGKREEQQESTQRTRVELNEFLVCVDPVHTRDMK